jgi:hypothetical protein
MNPVFYNILVLQYNVFSQEEKKIIITRMYYVCETKSPTLFSQDSR